MFLHAVSNIGQVNSYFHSISELRKRLKFELNAIIIPNYDLVNF